MVDAHPYRRLAIANRSRDLQVAWRPAGSPDLLIIRAGQPLFLELKAPGRNLSPVQTECHDALRRAGATVETADNIDTALAFLARAGVMR